jgi:prepilin-type N-terminal cleavage/methylation domain-containing protein
MHLIHLHSPRKTKLTSRFQAGFTLVEMMIAVALGLIVVLAAVGFVVSIAKANSENIRVTRLTQQLRSISEVMTREIRRSRYVSDPISLIGSGGTNNRDSITITDNGNSDCIVFGYDEPPDPPAPAVTVSRSIRLAGNNILLNPDATGCTGGSPLNSADVRITQLNFVLAGSQVDIVVSGALADAPSGSNLADVTRTFRQTVYVRSGQVD